MSSPNDPLRLAPLALDCTVVPVTRRPHALRRLHQGAVAALLSAACGLVGAQVTDVSGIAGLFDKVLSIQPIRVCNTSGSACPSTPIFPDHLLRTLAQAQIATVVLPTRSIYDTSLHGVDDLGPLNQPGQGQSSNRNTINAWFVDELSASAPNLTLFGLGYVDGNGVAINSSAVTAAQRRDTFTHEVGHNLGLHHDNFGAGTPDNLMTRGSLRSIPATGLTGAQIQQMRGSPLLEQAPQVLVDFDFQEGAFSTVNLNFASGPADVRLMSLAIDLPDFGPSDVRQRPAYFDAQVRNVSGSVPDVSFSYVENMQTEFAGRGGEDRWTSTNGGPELVIQFGLDGMALGQTLSFEMGVTGNLRGEYTYEIARDLYGADAEFTFDFGLSASVLLQDAAHTTDSRAIVALLPSVADPRPFGAQLAPGELAAVGTIDRDPVAVVPEPASAWLALCGGLALAARLRRRRC